MGANDVRTVTELLVGVLEQVRAIKHTDIKDRTSTETTTSARMGVGSWIILIVLLSLLVATGVVIYLGWTLGNGTDVSTSSYVAMVFGGGYFAGRGVRSHGASLLQQPKRI